MNLSRRIITFFFIGSLFLLSSCMNNQTISTDAIPTDASVATFAGGCFWCMEGPFEAEPGVYEAIAGYAGGEESTATYEQVSSGTTKHREGVQIYYNPAQVSYDRLLEIYFQQIDPTDAGGQFADRGFHYTTAVYYHNDEQRDRAERQKSLLGTLPYFKGEIVTEILPFTTFFPAEEKHQDFYKKSSEYYKQYKQGSGRGPFLEKLWGPKEDIFEKPSKKELQEMLTPLQYKVTQQDGTEKPFDNTYWDNKEAGIYVDIVSGEPLFSSLDKYESGTGWPSFTRPLVPANVVEKEDRSWFTVRTEVRSKLADSHLGHVFPDGPQEEGGLRYCMNSAALNFIPKDELEEKGYGEFSDLFE